MTGRSRRRRKPPGATTRGGWGAAHQRRRAAIAPIVNAGKATCARCGEPIHAGEEWHLDHDDADRRTYLGPSHKRCNLAAGAYKVNGNRPAPHFEERPYKWSQRWHDDPPIGTTVNLGGGKVEIYAGNGEWHTVDADALAHSNTALVPGSPVLGVCPP